MNEYKDLSKFYNTYHFVPLGKEVDRKEQKKGKLYTGKIEVELTTKTPLFIPNLPERAISPDGHKTYDFFTYDGKNPVIPGSSLRGMLRSVYETVTNSCLSVVDLDEKPVRRTNETYLPGLLHFDESENIILYKAGKAVVKNNIRPDYKSNNERYQEFIEGKEVMMAEPQIVNKQNVTRRVCLPEEHNQYTDVQKWITGYYFKGEAGANKNNRTNFRTGLKSLNAYVFYLIKSNNIVSSDLKKYDAIQELKDVLASYDEYTEQTKKSLEGNLQTAYNGYKEYREQLEIFLTKKQGYFPVHYSEVTGYIYLSPACITKEVYYTDINSILKEQGEHVTCSSIREMCPACRLFGMVSNKELDDKEYPNAWASLVKVQDAVLVEEKSKEVYYDKDITLMELASPKKSSTEFYLQKPIDPNNEEVISWTYDYYVARRNKGKPEVKKYVPKISGRKFYWHHQKPNLPESNIDPSSRNCTVRPVSPNVKFKFTIAFDKIADYQLKQLIWLCNISNNNDKNGQYGYKLGKGKPLGMGSIELKVLSVKIRDLKAKDQIGYYLNEYESIFKESYKKLTYESVGFDTEIKHAFMKMCNFESTKGYPVTYPVSANQSVKIASDGYKWFVYNRYNYEGGNRGLKKREQLEFQQYMKPIVGSDSDNWLYVNAETVDCPASCIPKVSATDRDFVDRSNSVQGRCENINNCLTLKKIENLKQEQGGKYKPKQSLGKNNQNNYGHKKGNHKDRKNNEQTKTNKKNSFKSFSDLKDNW